MSKQFPGIIELNNDTVVEEMKDMSSHDHDHDHSTNSQHGSHTDISDIPFEEFLHYALIQRTQEEHSAHRLQSQVDQENPSSTSYKNPFGRWTNQRLPLSKVTSFEATTVNMTDDQLERANARRALRQAGWAAVFYLITTDILGPFNAPIAIAQLGYVLGIILYSVMGIAAFYCGILLWRLFIHLDSDRYPVKTYSDIFERIFGRAASHVCNALQCLQLIVSVGVICLGNGQSLAQIVTGESGTGYICFSIAIVIWALIGMVVGQIRTLQSFSLLANFSVWVNLLLIVTSMGFIAHSLPNYAAALSSMGIPMGPVVTHAISPLPATTKVNAVMQMVYAYGGAMIFPEIMAEMRRPMDFWKGMASAQFLIYTAYLIYGVFVYSYQGQFTLPLAYQGVSKYSWQTVGNVMGLITGIIAAALYGNIGIKIIYANIIEDWFKGPPLLSRKGHAIWSVMVVVYWALAFVVGSAIPQVENISSLIAAICIMQFSYTFPPALRLGYDVLTDAMSEDAVYVPGNGTLGRKDSWKDSSRWRRGFLTGRVWFKALNFVLAVGFLAMAGLGMWGTGVSIQKAFEVSQASSFSCTAPV
ncbi:MAG: transmembrane amino acid transporter protein-domain-containing protein [Linnemannia gamsii]|nr:MAG: transmembrane amino acid transporter protein-domain-containing protein [Linnemannia gamsii]